MKSFEIIYTCEVENRGKPLEVVMTVQATDWDTAYMFAQSTMPKPIDNCSVEFCYWEVDIQEITN